MATEPEFDLILPEATHRVTVDDDLRLGVDDRVNLHLISLRNQFVEGKYFASTEEEIDAFVTSLGDGARWIVPIEVPAPETVTDRIY